MTDSKPLRLSHYTAAKIKRVRSVEQAPGPDMKPHGLWVSVDGPDDWPEWCARTKHKVGTLRHRYRVTVDWSRLTILRTPEELDLFTRVFTVEEGWKMPIYIDWRRVAEKCAGLIIAPYQWSRRLSLLWYYGWDCASGCIWDATAVQRIKLLHGKYRQRHRDGEQHDRNP